MADEAGGGPLHPDVAAERGQTLRLSGQILAITGNLRPPVVFDTPDTMPDAPNKGSHRKSQPAGLGNQIAELLSTTVAQPSGNSPEDHLRKKPGRKVVTDLAIIAENNLFATGGRLLPTPRATDGTKGGPNQRGSSGDMMLPSAVMHLPTPRATRGGSATETVAMLPTPQAHDARGGKTPEQVAAAKAKSSAGFSNLNEVTDWGKYAPAIRRHEVMVGRPAPAPTQPSKTGRPQLSPRFTEWMMGWPDGWVTECGLSRNEALRACGNGVVPQQAAWAVRECLKGKGDSGE